jgi:hypothetical protein
VTRTERVADYRRQQSQKLNVQMAYESWKDAEHMLVRRGLEARSRSQAVQT